MTAWMSNYFLNSAILERNLRYLSPACTISWTWLFMKMVPDHRSLRGIQWENKIYSRGSELSNVQSAYSNTFPWIWVLVITVCNVQFPCWQNCFPFIVFIQNSLGKWFEYLTRGLLQQFTILDQKSAKAKILYLHFLDHVICAEWMKRPKQITISRKRCKI